MVMLLTLLACASIALDPSDTADTAPDAATTSCDPPDAEGWSEDTHLKGVDGDYDLLFSGELQRIDITLCPGDLERMHEDLADKVHVPQGGGPGGQGGPGQGGPGQGGPGQDGPGEDGADEDPIYVQATVAHQGRTWPAVGMRFKGNSSLSQAWQQGIEKLPFRLDFDRWEDEVPAVEDQRFHGFKELKFANGFNDDSLVRDKLMADLLFDAGVPVARGAFVEVWVDAGEGPVFWGVYTMFEDPCGELLDSWFQDDSGSCYKADGPGAALQDFDADSFEDKTNDGAAEDIEAFVAALNDGEGESWRAELERHFDVEGFLWAFAANNVARNWDTYGLMTHNYYLYADPGQGRLVWVPWDFGLAWEAQRLREPLSLSMDEVGDEWPLIRRLMDDPVYRALYEQDLQTLQEGVMAPEEVLRRADALQATIRDAALAEQAPYTCIQGSFDEAVRDADDAIADSIP